MTCTVAFAPWESNQLESIQQIYEADYGQMLVRII